MRRRERVSIVADPQIALLEDEPWLTAAEVWAGHKVDGARSTALQSRLGRLRHVIGAGILVVVLTSSLCFPSSASFALAPLALRPASAAAFPTAALPFPSSHHGVAFPQCRSMAESAQNIATKTHKRNGVETS